jgi:prepilin-type N-terminal cleavage/methylation domain-containing protein
MSRLKKFALGFTIIELLITIVIIGVASTAMYTLFGTSINQFLGLQKDGLLFGDLALQSQRIAAVLRGTTDITDASNDGLTFYGYFSPSDNYVSLVQYYKTNNGTVLKADVTPMTANPPNGTLITASKKTYTILDPFFSDADTNTFVYVDSSGNALTPPISDLLSIKAIQVNLAVPSDSPTVHGNQTISLQISLRNRKTNL